MNNQIEKIKPSGIFTNYIFKSIPLAFDESLSYYETLCALLSYLKNVESVVNNNADVIKELENYVTDYFKNLDVQTEINNKLDNMAESGQLADIISQYLNTVAIQGFNSVTELKQATNLNNGAFVKTYGYYSLNDGGSALYKIRDVINTDVIDDMFIIRLNNENLVAELIIDDKLDILKLGCIGDGVTDNATKLQLIINKSIQTGIPVFIPIGKFYVSNTLTINSKIKIYGAINPNIWIGNDKVSTLTTDLSNKPLIVVASDGLPYQYDSKLVEDVEISNLKLLGNANNRAITGLYLSTYISNFKNLVIENFYNAIYSSYSYETTFDNVKCYDCMQGFICNNNNYTTYLNNCWFEYKDDLSNLKEINDDNYLNLYSNIPSFVLTGIMAINSVINLNGCASEYYCYGIYNRNSRIFGNSIGLEVQFNSPIYIENVQSTHTPIIDLTNVYYWNHQGYNAKNVIVKSNCKVNLEFIGNLPTQGYGQGYEIDSTSICRIYSKTQGERIVPVTPKDPNGYQVIFGEIYDNSHYTKDGFLIDYKVQNVTSWLNRETYLSLTPSLDFTIKKLIPTITVSDGSIKYIALTSNKQLLELNGAWITNMVGKQLQIKHFIKM